MSETNDLPFTCAACRKRKRRIYSYYGNKKLCSKTCRDAYIEYEREEAQARARKRIAQAQQSKPTQPQRKSTPKSGFWLHGKEWKRYESRTFPFILFDPRCVNWFRLRYQSFGISIR